MNGFFMTGTSSSNARTFIRLAYLVAVLALLMGAMMTVRAELMLWHARWYLPTHTAMEVFAVVVAALIFSTGWHSVDGRVPVRVAFLSPALLIVCLFDLAHLMFVPGMPGLDGDLSSLRGIEFWLLARSVGALALLAAALAPTAGVHGKRVHRVGVVLALALVLGGYWLVLFHPDLLPATYVPGHGATDFKIGWEYTLTALNTAAALLLVRRVRLNMGQKGAQSGAQSGINADAYLAAAAAIMALGEVNFTLKIGADNAFNTIAHVYKVIAYLCLHRAIYVEVVQAPYVRLRASERSLADSETKFRSLMECAPDAIMLASGEGRIAMLNARAEELFGIVRERAAGMPLDLLVPPADENEDVICHHPHSGDFPAEVRRASTPAGQQIVVVRDVSERRRLEASLLEQLTCDALTGLPNRRRILEMLGEAIATAREDGRVLAVVVLDIDEFRKINSGYGYAGGDDVLRDCVSRIGACLQPGDTQARQGGNEFIIVQRDAGQSRSGAKAGQLAETLLDAMRAPFVLDGQHVFLSASIGIALLPETPCAPHELLQMAQVAMASARADGRARWRFHTAEMDDEIRARVDLEALLRQAIEHGQFVLQYQPRVALAGDRIVGVEALVRWRHPTLGVVPPLRFIPLAEETGMIEQIDLWVLGEACRQAARWRAQGLPPLRVSVNLSARQFQQAGLATRVRAALESSGLPPSCLELEITESTVMRDTEEAAGVLRSLKALGVALSIDDFGTGYSSLSYLKTFPLDVLKIDRSFVADVIVDGNDAAITRAIIALAHSLNLEAVAEGVETPEQAAFLRENGCDELQGYLFSPPVWPEELERMLAQVDTVK
jgi:diguanylate cyclase (GGDEF)-like protein/PAS domain S-box-containing protein